MKALIVFYSRTGTTKKLAKVLGGVIDSCDLEELFCSEMKTGLVGYLKAGHQTFKKLKPAIEPIEHKPEQYDIVVVGTPVWIGTMSSPVRSYLYRYKDKFLKTAFFCTCGDKQDMTFEKMKGISASIPIATLEIVAKKINSPESLEKVKDFVKIINSV
ncbi:MAG: hypothetical protein U9O20_03320 [Patescibacteria group bacterium]|nr:hypothetical protein [Patescibacteria group bacterium]